MVEALSFGAIGAVIGVGIVLIYFAIKYAMVFGIKAIKKQGAETPDQ